MNQSDVSRLSVRSAAADLILPWLYSYCLHSVKSRQFTSGDKSAISQ